MPNLGTTEIIIIALVVLVLFGSRKLPDAARSFGRSLRIFKAETKGLREDDLPAHAAPSAPAPAPAVQPAVPLPIESSAVPATSVNNGTRADAERR
ncbi:Sec-independent protein translocase subunit TatA [Frankia sp. Mgl5]|uniref:Sec-independent protein translocase subunit TatA n=1 Tax=Frankia sp. Mgl5 TaxID=2933793 RepID=UPI00200CE45E|nr:Sec-independent protein translocase subunit TatA [Frankia sp. Mgl5]MCK9929592.1 Sec-independent protein translocase subunit TatA [Frankia sp. Mgl5]